MKDVLDLNLQNFLRSILPDRDDLLKDMEKYALENHVSIVEPEVGQLLNLLVNITKPKKILEIGTAIGYSTICMARALNDEEAKITSVEILPHRIEMALNNFEKAGVIDKINVINGDAKDIVPNLSESYDFIFFDAAKGQYPRFLKMAKTLLKPNGLIVADNVLINGWVIDLNYPERRKKTMVTRMRTFLEELKDNSDFVSSVIPLGDGVAVIWRKE